MIGAIVAMALPALALAQSTTAGAADPLRAALDALKTTNAWTLSQQHTICEVAAPPFKEARRAAEFRRRLRALGITDVRIDSEGNVIGRRPGSGGPTVVLSAHLDTVFPESVNVSVTQTGRVMKGPGIGDDCRGLAVVLAVARAMQSSGIRTKGTVLFVGTVGEEGPGNLRGVRHLFTKEMPGKIDYFISVDGTGLGLVHGGVGSKRYTVSIEGPGGHSYGAFGMPNPIHAMGRAIAAIADIQVPRVPRTTFNVGIVRGGTSVNSIPMSGAMDIDMRSESIAALDSLERQVMRAIDEAVASEKARWPDSKAGLTVRVDTIGIRPAGQQPDTAAIVRTAVEAARRLGFTPSMEPSSTDSNIPISLGIPAITIDGGGEGRGAHSISESYDDGEKGWLGPQWALLITTALAGLR